MQENHFDQFLQLLQVLLEERRNTFSHGDHGFSGHFLNAFVFDVFVEADFVHAHEGFLEVGFEELRFTFGQVTEDLEALTTHGFIFF